ncbi:MAG: tetratricopeptide repeat protein [Planctomycetes bacterium]|nr:tetratricopeptide repeat protein [Planctomycetota bacterium]
MIEAASSRSLPAFATLWLLLAVAMPACQSMTSAQRARAERVEKQKEEAAATSARSAAEVAELDRQGAELQRMAQAAAARLERENRLREAQALLAKSEPKAALEIIDGILEAAAPLAAPPGTEARAAVPGEQVAPPAPPPPPSPPPLEPAERARVLVLRARALYDLGDNPGALVAFKEAVENDSTLRVARINLGKLYFLEQRYEEALAAWNLELADGYRSSDLLFLVAQALYETGQELGDVRRLEAARVALTEALVANPTDMELVRWNAVLALETGHIDDAIRLFEQILHATPLDAGYLELLAECYRRKGEWERMADQLEIAARIQTPGQAQCRTLGDLYAEIDFHDRAADWYVRAFGAERETASAKDRFLVGATLAGARRGEEAIAWLSTLDETDAEFAEAMREMGVLHSKAGDGERALRCFERAASARPDDGELYLMLGDLYLERRELERAQDAFARAAGLADTDADGLAGLGEVSYARADLPKAIDFYKQACELRAGEPRFAAAVSQLEAERSLRQGDGEAASP